jgi:hypothetical protein
MSLAESALIRAAWVSIRQPGLRAYGFCHADAVFGSTDMAL